MYKNFYDDKFSIFYIEMLREIFCILFFVSVTLIKLNLKKNYY